VWVDAGSLLYDLGVLPPQMSVTGGNFIDHVNVLTRQMPLHSSVSAHHGVAQLTPGPVREVVHHAAMGLHALRADVAKNVHRFQMAVPKHLAFEMAGPAVAVGLSTADLALRWSESSAQLDLSEEWVAAKQSFIDRMNRIRDDFSETGDFHSLEAHALKMFDVIIANETAFAESLRGQWNRDAAQGGAMAAAQVLICSRLVYST